MRSKFLNSALLTSFIILLLASCHSALTNKKMDDPHNKINELPDSRNFNAQIDNKQTALYILKNKNGMKAAITNYGGRLVSLMVPDSAGKLIDVVAGFDNVLGFKHSTELYYGATIGRYGNRIANGKFKIEDKEYTLFKNNGSNTLHGGKKGFQDVVWTVTKATDTSIALTYLSPDMEEGFPGNLHVEVTFSLSESNALKINFSATTDKPTVVNLTNHAYFNLNGTGSGTILNHLIEIKADTYIPVDATLIPLGHIDQVKGTPFDFRQVTTIGKRINEPNDQLKRGNGYDHNYVLNKHSQEEWVAKVEGDKTGIVMDVYTSEPGLQFYTGNFMAGKNLMKGGTKDNFRTAFAMETQHYPDSPNQSQFPSTLLNPGIIYKTSTSYVFEKYTGFKER